MDHNMIGCKSTDASRAEILRIGPQLHVMTAGVTSGPLGKWLYCDKAFASEIQIAIQLVLFCSYT